MADISYKKAITRLFYPVTCYACEEALVNNEICICTHCRLSMPYTNYHQEKQHALHTLFKGRMQVNFISSYLFYDQEISTQHLLHAIKYKGRKELAEHLGEWYGHELQHAFSSFSLPDLILPVPLHRKKQRLRGYNQSEYWARGLSKTLQVPTHTGALVKTTHTSSQTRKSRADRVENVAEVFKITAPEQLQGKHVLLVDDVITTGATLEACGNRLWEAGISSLSIATIAYAAK